MLHIIDDKIISCFIHIHIEGRDYFQFNQICGGQRGDTIFLLLGKVEYNIGRQVSTITITYNELMS